MTRTTNKPTRTLPPIPDGLALTDRLLLALKDGDGHSLADVLSRLWPPPGDRPPAAGRTTPPDQVDAERLAQLRLTARQLQQDGWITITGAAAQTPGPEAILRLEPPEPDPRFAIDPVFRDLLPPPSPGELAELERQLLTEGCRDALVTWSHDGRTVLIDGYTRLTICLRHRRPYALSTQELDDRKAVVAWMWAHHYGRRNFTPEAESYARGQHFLAQKLGHGGDRRSKPAASTQGKQAAAELARLYRVNRATIFRDARYAEALDRIAELCGAAFRTQVLCRGVRLGRGRAALLAAKDEAQMKQLAEQLLAGRKVTLSSAASRVVHLALPRGKPAEQATTLIQGLGRKQAKHLTRELIRHLRPRP